MKRLAWSTIAILATFTALLLVWEFRSAVILFVLSLVVAATLRPTVDWFARRGLRRGLALLVTYVVCVGFFATLVVLLSGPLVTDLQLLVKDATSGYEQLRTQWPNGTPFQRSLVQQLPAASDLYTAITGPQGGTLLKSALGLTLGSFDVLSQMVIILVLSIYWSTDQEHFKRLWVSLLPFDARAQAREIWQNIEAGLGGYLRSQVIQSVIAAIVLSLGYQILGLKYPTALGLIGTISWLIPWMGVLLAVVPVIIVGLSANLWLAVAGAGFTIGLLCFLEFVVEPRLFNRRHFSSLLVVIVVLVMLDQFGLIGILIGPPLAAVIQIFVSQIIRSMRPVPVPQLTLPVSAFEDRLKSVQDTLAAQPEPPTPEVGNLVDRLSGLIVEANQV